MDSKTLSTILGHVSSATTLNTYSHVTDEMRQRTAVKIDQGIVKAEVREGTATAQPERTMTTFQARKRWSREASRGKTTGPSGNAIPGGPVFAVCGQTCGQVAHRVRQQSKSET